MPKDRTAAPAELVHLTGGGVSVLLDARGPGVPAVVHWGAALGELDEAQALAIIRASVPAVPPSSYDEPTSTTLLPEYALGWSGTPGLLGHREGADFSPLFRLRHVHRDGNTVTLDCSDDRARLLLTTRAELTEQGLLRLRHTVRNDGTQPYALQQLAAVLPIPPRAREVLDLTGRWCRERHPQRHELGQGRWAREGRHGRTGADATLLLTAGTPGFGFRHGEVWSVHLAWSGDHASWAERLPTGAATLGAAELLWPGEVRLEPGDGYTTPELFAAWSDNGLDGMSAAFHGWLRARPEHPRSPRPIVLNTWEAVYFDHDLAMLTALADAAAEVGVERFVLDDGWFRHRRNDSAGLGDWYVDEGVWPQGLHPLVDHVHERGMQFGLWVEPEMIQVDSDLYRAHPDWVLGTPGRPPPPWRQQQVLDLTRDAAFDHVLQRLDALLNEYRIDYLKWDHNRDLADAARGGESGAPAGVHAQTLATYRLLDELRRRHPGVEIESCSSGGMRVDLGILARTDRVWASDCNDALERQTIQRWTGLLLPPELVGSHVGPEHSHTTGRVHELSFRAITALFGHAGIEADITALDAGQRKQLASWIRLYKQERSLLHSGSVVRADLADPALQVHGVVAADRRRALFAFVRLATSADATTEIVLPGLDPDLQYLVQPVLDAGAASGLQRTPPPWYADGSVSLSGRALAYTGLAMPIINPEQAVLLRLTALD